MKSSWDGFSFTHSFFPKGNKAELIFFHSILQCLKKNIKVSKTFPLDTGCTLNVNKTFKRRVGRLLNVLCTFKLHYVSKGLSYLFQFQLPIYLVFLFSSILAVTEETSNTSYIFRKWKAVSSLIFWMASYLHYFLEMNGMKVQKYVKDRYFTCLFYKVSICIVKVENAR